ncbi:protein kinase [Microthyrium microscopicum]|uniref:Protein kinase n=1 Tax=Microthyrium microscopicum TaxID=703497 RepID=A0A6A6UNA5_9PEZI|nr:protein kinase [Microthyrium microscopicum]
MDFLKSAVASAISKGPAFPYSFDDRIDTDASIWTLHNSTKREDGSKCSVFAFDVTANKSRLPLARNAVRKLRTLRHPGVIRVLDTVETETYIYVATERVTPLSWHAKRKSLSQETIKWGLHSVAKTVGFINNEATSVHGYIRTSTVFTTESGEWKLGGFEVLSSMKEEDAIIYNYGSLTPDSGRYSPPEIGKAGWGSIKSGPVHAIDAYLFGILMYEVFNSSYMGTDQLTQPKLVPVSMQPSYKRLISANPKVRLSVGAFLDQGMRSGGFFETPLIRLTDGIENLGVKDETERDELLEQLEGVSEDFPEDFFKVKVLPELVKSVEFGGGGPRVFSVIMKISSKLSEEEYEQRLNPVIVRLFASPDRALRVCLLDNLPQMIDHLPQKLVSNSIWPQMVAGFTDIAPLVREQTVKAVLVVVPKLTDRIINGELLRHLAKTANDEQAGIRTNTTICLGKIARNLGSGSRTKVLTAAFARALRDPFVHARNAALMALAATADVYSDEECATKILPGLCPSLIDKEKMIRDQTSKTMEIFMHRVRKYAQTLPDTISPPPGAAANTQANQPRMGAAQAEGAGWTGWAISSFTNKIASVSGQMQDAPNGATDDRPSSVPPLSNAQRPPPSTTSLKSLQSGPAVMKSSKPNPFAISAAPEKASEPDDDLDNGWDDAENAWGDGGDADNDVDPWAPASTEKAPASFASYDDKGEPDFEGWLSAQSKSKLPSKKPLPKGLTKTAKPHLSKANSTGTAVPKKTVAAPAKKKEEPKKAEEEDEGWGDEWD